MCMALYLATDETIPMSEITRAGSFFVEELRPLQDKVRQQFTKPVVRYVGAFGGQGCSCAFSHDPGDRTDELGRRLIEDLRDLVASQLERGREVELFYCWMDDEGEEPERRVDTTPSELGGESCVLETGTFYRVHGAAQRGDAPDEALS
jgi:hypothetical protein